ncbi:MAG TPA: PQQ-dependent sugar dehydrogenase [Solirubrobacterales bacterium]|nr:PQQ-dependent sugar dehydrogenase [Solirubrobacterales bacterium]
MRVRRYINIPLAALPLAALLLAVASPIGADKGRKRLKLIPLAKFDHPTFVAAPRGAGDIAYVTEREGRIRILDGGRKRGTFLDMRRWVGCCEVETGLLSVAFPHDYARTRRFYVYFTNRQRNIEVDQFRHSRRDPLQAQAKTRRKIIEIRQRGKVNHNGGQVAFGPDGMLYLATGDGGSFDHPSRASQRKASLLGKLLRIKPQTGKGRPYRIPASNPYARRPGRGEIYARGLRNPFRFSFDRKRMLIADVGQDHREEVDIERVRGVRGANFGWSVWEGTKRFRGGHIAHHDKPAFQYGHSGSRCSIIGGYVVRDPKIRRLRGRYVYGDYCSGELRSFRPTRKGSRGDRSLGLGRGPGFTSFGTDARNRIYVVELARGRVSRLALR